jgi:hypothetical protein
MNDPGYYTDRTLAYVRHLSETIGGRGSCTPQVKRAGEYVAEQLDLLGARSIHTQSFKAIPGTYHPYALSFGSALAGSLLAFSFGSRSAFVVAAILNALGFWGMLAETEFTSSWVRWLLPKSMAQNVMSVVSPTEEVRRRVVLNAHLDTHRTPIFYSSRNWHKLFSALVGFTLLSMALGVVAFGTGALFDWRWMHWLSLGLVPVQAFALELCLQANFTPYTPGANDNASGVGVILGLAERLIDHPLKHTEVHLVFTDCEEAGAYGIQAYLDAHASSFGEDTVYVILDEVGNGAIKYLTQDGLVIKHKTHPSALELANAVSNLCPGIKVFKGAGVAYTDALPATRRGLIALTLCTLPPRGSGNKSHWHQMSDTFEYIEPEDLANIHHLTWQILKSVEATGVRFASSARAIPDTSTPGE